MFVIFLLDFVGEYGVYWSVRCGCHLAGICVACLHLLPSAISSGSVCKLPEGVVGIALRAVRKAEA